LAEETYRVTEDQRSFLPVLAIPEQMSQHRRVQPIEDWEIVEVVEVLP
jgi:hypothetical protein